MYKYKIMNNSKVGLNRFIMLVRMDDLTDYSKNHYEILDPYDDSIKGKIVREIGTLVTRPYPDSCGVYYNDISNYDVYTLDQNLKIFRKNQLYIPENMQFVILLNKSIEFPEIILYNIINVRVVNYLKARVPEFVEITSSALYQKIKYSNYKLDPLANL